MVSAKAKRQTWFFAVLWAVPGLLTLTEAHRLAGLPKFQVVSLVEGPIGYMTAIGSLLIGFSLWEIICGLIQRADPVSSRAKTKISVSGKIWVILLFMILFLLLIPFLGFVLGSGFFLAAALLLLGCTVKVTIVTDLCYCGGLYWMVPLLGLSLPRGVLGI